MGNKGSGWEEYLEAELDRIGDVLQSSSLQAQSTSGTADEEVGNQSTFEVQVSKTTAANAQAWILPQQISQSTYAGRVGRNACSLIALIVAYAFYVSSSTNTNLFVNSLPGIWVRHLITAITTGSAIHDSNFNH